MGQVLRLLGQAQVRSTNISGQPGDGGAYQSRRPHGPWSHLQNHILAALPEPDLERLRPHLRPVLLPAGTVLCEPGAALKKCYFLNRGLVSFMMTSVDGHDVEVALLGMKM